MKKYIITLAASLILATGCKKALEVGPKGSLNESQVATPAQAEGFVTAAYSQLGNDEINRAFSMYQYGNIRADDAYKGGGGINDGDVFHNMETFIASRPDQWNYDGIWFNIYVGIRRANEGIRVLSKFSETEYPLVKTRIAELRFLRGYWYLMLENLFKNIPYIDDTVPSDEYKNIKNNALSRDQILEKIAGDFQAAAEALPATQPQIGRANKFAAYAFLAKTRLFQAYTQNATHAVTGIDQNRLQQVIDASDQVLASSYKLQADFANNFTSGTFENGTEAIMSVQFSSNDGAGRGRVNFGDMLTVPQGIGCCDFQKPSQTLMNAFRTTTTGIPLFDTFNQQNVDFATNTVDPRVDHTISRPGAPWKYDPARVVTASWSRNIPLYGTYNSMKENVSPDCDCFINVAPFFGNTKARIMIRLADVMLFKAEALIELGRQSEALPIINAIRDRASKSTAKLVMANGQPTSKYNVQQYVPGTNIVWDQANARKALRFERRLEMALEGERFFDLIRWGVADQVINSFFDSEKSFRSIYMTARFTKGRDEYLPIPQNQIFFSENNYVQNPGY
ncbi:RagB/SusD family nutrient uptake outer membrane protein [Pedobacter alluvionis]|uniref:Putative outer membrane starch-binding protein n=1 Tax=Pedobacter alluvionis TaxID=475253 RepID=A0A497YA20_9SPHI|nr:RagB/SusD family nutrient uptake outer membrane protein [Pedobacter alluvionis]RLJ80065.1 putative outer membrane starch-binding protein [Pedobacter alluvionis]TFB31361.1 RagB/SusD family nutrient uptake outer membrane protein [Pedobacter alluvionis]